MAFKVVFGATAAFVLFFNSLPITVATPVESRQLQLPDLNVGFPPNVTLLMENVAKFVNEVLLNSNPNGIDLLETVRNAVTEILEGAEGGPGNLFEEISELVLRLLNGTPVKPDVIQSRQLVETTTTNVEATTTSSVEASNGLNGLFKEIADFVSVIIKLSTGESLDTVQTRQIDPSTITSGIDLLSNGLALMKQSLDVAKPFLDAFNTLAQNAPTYY